jgi:hypothetical protein
LSKDKGDDEQEGDEERAWLATRHAYVAPLDVAFSAFAFTRNEKKKRSRISQERRVRKTIKKYGPHKGLSSASSLFSPQQPMESGDSSSSEDEEEAFREAAEEVKAEEEAGHSTDGRQ